MSYGDFNGHSMGEPPGFAKWFNISIESPIFQFSFQVHTTVLL